MEILRATLKILYSQQDPKQILNVVRQNPKDFVDGMIDSDTFKRLLCREFDDLSTLDNADSVSRHLNEQWLCSSKDVSLTFAERKTVFNVLLHFTSEVLVEKNMEPVCRYEHLLRWHNITSHISEDLLTTSYLAAHDLYNHRKRYTFCWSPVIGHDNRTLNELFGRPMMDLHFHLNGSSLNFEINWMSLMNRTSGWIKEFRKLRNLQQNVPQMTDGQSSEPFYLGVMRASALRLLLFKYLICGQSDISVNETYVDADELDVSLAKHILEAESIDDATPYIKDLDIVTQRLRHLYGKRYSSHEGTVRIPDYATLEKLAKDFCHDDCRYVLSVMSGERWMVYSLFRDIYSSTKIDKKIVAWFYAYLLYKLRFRSELIQNNTFLGFSNFGKYERRKSLFVRSHSVYNTLLSQLAVVSYLGNSDNRWLEARIAPKEKRRDFIQLLRTTKANIADRHFMSDRLAHLVENHYGLVLHFIKQGEQRPDDEKKYFNNIQLGQCRHYNLRYKIRRQSHAILHLRQSLESVRDNILGIDAANSEVYARPEVFAQAFRFLREATEDVVGTKMLPDLGMTYHVGEDFLDVTDGLRAVDELIQFLRFRNGDRLGHGVVLGIDVLEYYRRAHGYVILPKQVLLDNAVWLYFKGKNLPEFLPASKDLEVLFETYCRQIYGHIESHYTILDYYQSWMLRGDNPLYYFSGNRANKHKVTSRWGLYNLNDNPMAREARENIAATQLYEAYHFDPCVRTNGEKTAVKKLSDEVVAYISAVQKQMLSEIERDNIHIECNPTSNLKIGHFDSYSTHPIIRMNNDRLPLDEEPHSISVSINTDDKGIFATSLEREYSLLALSLEKKYVRTGKCSPKIIYEWLDRIRQMSAEQRFCPTKEFSS